MRFREPHNTINSRWIARAAARFHSIEMPLSKEPKWLFETIEAQLKLSRDQVFTRQADVKRYQQLMSYDYEKEYAQLK